MNRRRYEGYIALQSAIARQGLVGYPASLLAELAEGLLLASDEQEACKAAAPVPDGLVSLVARGELSRFAAHRFWTLIRMCGPRVAWPTSWDHPLAASRPAAVRGR
jgi:hypothetical protein